MLPFNERAKAALTALGTTPYKFANDHGFNRASLFNLVTKDRHTSFELVERVCLAEPRISAEYMLRGEGSPLRSQDTQNQPVTPPISLPAPCPELRTELTHHWLHLRSATNQVIDEQLQKVNGGQLGQRRTTKKKKEEVADQHVLIDIRLKQLADMFARMQQNYTQAINNQAGWGVAFPLEKPSLTDIDRRQVLQSAHHALVETGGYTEDELMMGYKFYNVDLLCQRGKGLIPIDKTIAGWPNAMHFQGESFIQPRLSRITNSMAYFLSPTRKHEVAKHYIDLAKRYLAMIDEQQNAANVQQGAN